MAVRVCAPDMDAAVRSATSAASIVAVIVSFCVNAVVEPPSLHLAFNSTEDLSRREFMEAFLPDEAGHPRIGRWIDGESLFAFGQAAFASAEAPRLARALAQYQAALRYWNTGSRVLVLTHLYIACEALTKAVQRLHQARLGLTEKQHALLLGVDITKTNWPMMAGNFARCEYIFEGDKRIYDAAKEARNEFEHGTADLGNVRQTADDVTRELFDLVRSAVLSLVPSLDQTVCEAIMSKRPVDVSPLHKQVAGYIVSDQPSDPGNLGIAGELFPALKWRSDIKAVTLEGDNLAFEPVETFTVQFAPGLRFEGSGYAIYGGLNPAPAAAAIPDPGALRQVALVTSDLAVGNQGVRLLKRDLLADVMPLVNAATASGIEIPQEFPRSLAFRLFGQGVAYFQSAQTLIAGRQPVEALPLLRGLVIVAARFEQMTQDGGDALGLVVRLALDALDDQRPGNIAGLADAARDGLLQGAGNAGLPVPDDLPPVESTTIWRGLTFEMQLARHAVDASIGIAELHLKPGDDADRANYQIRLEPGPLTDLIASACVIAQLELLRHAAPVFGWTIDTSRIDALMAEARELNDASARSGDRAQPSP